MGVLLGGFGVPEGWRRLAGLSAGVLVGAVVFADLGAPPAYAAPGPEAADESVADADEGVDATGAADQTRGRDGVLYAPDPLTARSVARLTGERVEVMSERTETTQVYALPDGTMAAGVAAGPLRVQTGEDGGEPRDWSDLDLTLVRGADGMVRAAVHPGGLTLAGGSTEQTVTDEQTAGVAPEELSAEQDADAEVTEQSDSARTPATPGTSETIEPVVVASMTAADGHQTGLSWVGSLPVPELTGPRAVYRDVEPGIDMVVEATASGFEQFFVLHEAPRDELVLPVQVWSDSAEVTEDPSGEIVVADGDGTVVARVLEPTMWDAAADAARLYPVTEPWLALDVNASRTPAMPDWGGAAPVEEPETAPAERPLHEPGRVFTDAPAAPAEELVVDREVSVLEDGTLAVDLAPQPSFLKDDATVYPVVVDPQVELSIGFDTSVQSGTTSNMSGEPELRVGSWNGGTNVARSFVRVTTSPIAGRRVLAAELGMVGSYSYSCSARNWEVWHTGDVSTSTRWTAQPGWISQQAVVSATRGYSSACAPAWVSAPITGAMSWAASNSASTMTLGLRATNESDSASWKRFLSSENGAHGPYVWVNYASNPNTPSALVMTPAGEKHPQDGFTYTSTRMPTLSATVSHPDGDALTPTWEVLRNGTVVRSATHNPVANNGTTAWRIPDGVLQEGLRYTVRVRVASGGATSAWRSMDIQADTTAPRAPQISSTTFPVGGSGGAVNTDGTFRFTPSGPTDNTLVRYVWGLNAAPDPNKKTTANQTAGVNQAVRPTHAGRNVLRVQAVDYAGNVSGVTEYEFYVGHRGDIVSPGEGQRVTRYARIELAPPGPEYTRVELRVLPGDDNEVAWQTVSTGVRTSGGTAWVPTGLYGPVPAPGEHLIWDVSTYPFAVDQQTVQLQAVFRTAGTATASTKRVRFVVDRNASGASTTEVGPGSLNLLTGDYRLTETDVDIFDLAVARTSSSRDPLIGYQTQSQRLSASQRSASSLTGVTGGNANVTLNTSIRRGEGTSYRVTPSATATSDLTFASVGGDVGGGMSLGMRAGRTYRISGWIYVPGPTQLNPSNARGQRITLHTKNADGTRPEPLSTPVTATPAASVTDRWEFLSVVATVPEGSTEAFIRLNNGSPPNSNRHVYFDDLSVEEVWAPLGPQWQLGAAELSSGSVYTKVSRPASGVAVVTVADGGEIYFLSEDNVSWTPMAGAEGMSLAQTGSAASPTGFRLVDLDGTVTTFSAQTGSKEFPVATSSPPAGSATDTRYVYDVSSGRSMLTRVIGPIEPGVANTPTSTAPCTGSTVPAGCRVLRFTYYTTTTATASTPGAFRDRLQQVEISTVAGATNAGWQPVAQYSYDVQGRLARAWDPRLSSLITAYTYDAAGRVVSVSSPGTQPFSFLYATDGSTGAGADRNAGRLVRMNQNSLAASPHHVNSTRVFYGVPTHGTGAPYNLSPDRRKDWAQLDGPVSGTAVFEPYAIHDLASAATTATVTAGQYQRSTIHYVNGTGLEVNTAAPLGAVTSAVRAAGYIETTEYDASGNVVRSLDATNRLVSLDIGAENHAARRQLGFGTETDSIALSQLLDQRHVYSADRVDVVRSTGPVQLLARANEPLSVQLMRPVTLNTYDEGRADRAPDGVNYHLLLETAYGAEPYPAGGLVDGLGEKREYDPIDGAAVLGPTSGWVHKQPTRITTGMTRQSNGSLAGGTATAMLYDHRGRVLQTRLPGSSGADAATNETIYYTVAANAKAAACGGSGVAHLAGLECITRAAGPVAVAAGNTGRMSSQLPVARTSSYNPYGEPSEVVETVTGPRNGSTVTQTRTTRTDYDLAGRVTDVRVTGTNMGPDVARVRTTYTAVGQVAETQQLNASGTVTARVTRAYDALGRVTRYVDASGAATTTTYDQFGKPVTVTDPSGTRTLDYDRAVEPRGFLTSFTDSVVGTDQPFRATWGPDGQLQRQELPGGVRLEIQYDPARVEVGRTYTDATSGQVLLQDSVVENHRGQWLRHTSSVTGGLLRDTTYRYDVFGRLTDVKDEVADTGVCTWRAYDFDVRGSRTALRSTVHEVGPRVPGSSRTPEQACPRNPRNGTTGAGDSAVTYTNDGADRLVSDTVGGNAWVYDPFGRVTTFPAAGGNVVNEFFVNDLVASQTQGTGRGSWTLDPMSRRWVHTTASSAGGSWVTTGTKTSVYGGDGDNPSYIRENTSGTGPLTRYVPGLDGNTAMTTGRAGDRVLLLSDLHGDVVTTVPIANGAARYNLTGVRHHGYDEYGNPLSLTAGSGPVSPGRYGWLGVHQRSTEALGGVVLMGVRLYLPTIGRFLSVDPVYGGNTTAYVYPQDPINKNDLDGKRSRFRSNARHHLYMAATGMKLAGRISGRGIRIYFRARHRLQAAAIGRGVAAVSRMTGGRCSHQYGVRVCQGGLRMYARGGTTLGTTFVTGRNATISADLMAHEARHVAQWRHFGSSMALLYPLSGANACRNRFEIHAGLDNGGYTWC